MGGASGVVHFYDHFAGEGMSEDVLRQAGGNNQTSVAITDTLQAGSYTIEASTWQPKTLGDFTLTLTTRR